MGVTSDKVREGMHQDISLKCGEEFLEVGNPDRIPCEYVKLSLIGFLGKFFQEFLDFISR